MTTEESSHSQRLARHPPSLSVAMASKIIMALLMGGSQTCAFLPRTHHQSSRPSASSRRYLAESRRPVATWRSEIGPKKSRSANPSLSMSEGKQDGGIEGAGELVTALARMDKEWQLTRRNQVGGWQKLVIQEASTTTSSEYKWTDDLTPPPPDVEEEFCYLLEPPTSTTPSCIILFTGGAALGQFPHIAYGELLKRVANRLNAAVVAAPYEIGLDHFEIAKKNGELLRKAVIKLEDEQPGYYRSSTPKFMLSHSLGAKLQTISLAATGIGHDLQGVGFMSYNNFGFGSVIQQTRSFARALQGAQKGRDDAFGGAGGGGGQQDAMFDTLFNFAEMAVGAVGIEFSPSPTDTDRIVQMKYDKELQDKTRLFVFDDDDLDTSKSFVQSCQEGTGGDGPSVSGLPGTHLSPVYLKLGLNDLDLPEEAREIAGQVSGGFEGASFGDEAATDEAVSEICNWILGKSPTRGPAWDSNTEDSIWSGPRRLSGGVVDAEIEQ